MAAKRKKSNLLRVVSVLCGCLGAGWLFARGWQEVIDLFMGYRTNMSFIGYFFNTGLFPLATLMAALLFFVVSIRDLAVMKDGTAVASLIIDAIVGVAYVLYFIRGITAGSFSFGDFWFWYNVLRFILLLAYITYTLYCMNGSRTVGFAWTAAVLSAVGFIAAAVFGYVSKSISAANFIYIMISALSHLAVFYCGLKQY